jgi:hypothetical protein
MANGTLAASQIDMLSQSGTGIVTITPPATNTNRALTLPDAAGTIQVSGNPISGTTGSFSGDLSFNSGYGSAAVAYGCRAWVNFNGTGTPAIRASGNVSSITDNGTGDYTINFTTALPDADYSKVITSSPQYATAVSAAMTDVASSGLTEVAPTSTNFRLLISQATTATRIDAKYISASVFR